MSHAETIIRLCDRWHKLPSEILAEDVSVLRYLHIYERGTPEEVSPYEQ